MPNAEKNKKTYDYTSRYEAFNYYYDEKNNKYYYGITSFLDNATSFTSYTVKQGDSYDSIALNFYGSALLWWVICDYNRILDAFEPPMIDTVLKLPKLQTIAYLES